MSRLFSQEFNKFWYAFLTGVALSIASLIVATQDDKITVQEWLTSFGVLLPPFINLVSPANKISIES